MVNLIPGQAWLGGYQNSGAEEPSGGWRWSDGSAWDFENWKSGEPNDCCDGVYGKFGEDYLLGTGKEKGMKWNDGDGYWMAKEDGYVKEGIKAELS